jgi:TrmH family RNA methyltransferase
VRVATRPGAPRSLFDLDLTGDIAFLFGNEGGGLSRDLLATADRVVGIPMPGAAESINVAAAAAVCVFERVRQTGAKSRA